MARTYDTHWQNVSPASAPRSRGEALERLDWLSRLLDTALVIPGTKIRFGADAAIGLAPGVGDAITAALSCYIVYEAHRLGAPRHLIARMLGNVALDALVGSVPFFGDIFDVMFRANRRNVRLLREHFERQGHV